MIIDSATSHNDFDYGLRDEELSLASITVCLIRGEGVRSENEIYPHTQCHEHHLI